MNDRERLTATLTFGDPDRIFYYFGPPRRSTFAAWYLQGLPRMNEGTEYGKRSDFDAFVGNDHLEGLPYNRHPLPPFEEEIIETTEHGQIWRDKLGIVMHDAGRRLNTPGFNTRSYLSHPVKNREDWREMQKRFDPHSSGRYPDNWDQLVRKYRHREFPIMATLVGLYWRARDWVGFENLSMMFYDDPKLVHDMMEHNIVFMMEILKRAMGDGMVDCVMLNEDMAYKHASMISPAMFREFMLPRYKRLIAELRSYGLPVFLVDSDGHIGELIPLWIEAGADGCWPVEIAAHNDPVEYRKRFGNSFSLWGGIDKREIRSKEQVYEEVMKKVPWLVKQGGFLPMFDHGVPPDIPLRSFLYMCELIKAIAEDRKPPKPEDPLPIEKQLGPIVRMWSSDMAYDPDEEEY